MKISPPVDHHDIYIGHVDSPYGMYYAECVGRYQEGFLRDGACNDLDAAFARAVDVCERAIAIIKRKAGA